MKNHIKQLASFIACTGLFLTVARAQDMKDMKGMKMAEPAKSMKGMKMDESSMPMKGMKMDAASKKAVIIPDYSSVSPSVKTSVGILYTDYLSVKDALVQSSLAKAQVAGKMLSADAGKVNLAGLNPAQHKYVADLLEVIKEDGEHIGKTPELDHQRHHFALLTDEMYPLVKSFKPNVGKVYYNYCPMARAHKGAYWLSKESVIRNPFYGKKMIECGMTKETL